MSKVKINSAKEVSRGFISIFDLSGAYFQKKPRLKQIIAKRSAFPQDLIAISQDFRKAIVKLHGKQA